MNNKSTIKVKDVPGSGHVVSMDEIGDLAELLKANGYKTVLTQGVWDLIHEGHALYMEKSKSYGDILIVGVDSDELTKIRKGPNRPIVPQQERMRMISHLRPVDLIVVREAKHDIGELIRTVKPDVLIVSKSTKDTKNFTKQMKEDYGDDCGKIIDLEPQSTTSTTARIRKLTIDGAQELAAEIHELTDDFINKIKNGTR